MGVWVCGCVRSLLVLDTKSQGGLLRVFLEQLANAHCGIHARTQGKRNSKRLPVFPPPLLFFLCVLMVAYMLERKVRNSKRLAQKEKNLFRQRPSSVDLGTR